eukprot:4646924-Amphidinium_carterae.1
MPSVRQGLSRTSWKPPAPQWTTCCSLATAFDFSCASDAAILPNRAISKSLGSCVGRTTDGVEERVTTDLVPSCVLPPT